MITDIPDNMLNMALTFNRVLSNYRHNHRHDGYVLRRAEDCPVAQQQPILHLPIGSIIAPEQFAQNGIFRHGFWRKDICVDGDRNSLLGTA